jgi:hypothetical protein
MSQSQRRISPSAPVVGAASEQQIVSDYSSMRVRIPAKFWAELMERKPVEQDAPVPAGSARGNLSGPQNRSMDG